MVPRPQYTVEQRNFIALEYHKRKDEDGPRGLRGRRRGSMLGGGPGGSESFKERIIQDFQIKFPGVRIPSKNQLRNIWGKQYNIGTVHNLNSKSSPGDTHSGRPRTVRTQPNCDAVKNILDRDSAKNLGDANVSPVSSSRRNPLNISQSSFVRIVKEIR